MSARQVVSVTPFLRLSTTSYVASLLTLPKAFPIPLHGITITFFCIVVFTLPNLQFLMFCLELLEHHFEVLVCVHQRLQVVLKISRCQDHEPAFPVGI